MYTIVNMYNLPQEIEVWYIIPAIRKQLAKFLTEKHNLTYQEAGKILGVSKSAVSQYLKNKRACKINFPEKVKKEMEKSSDIIIKNPNLAVREILRVLTIVKQTKCSCKVCQKFNKGILIQCRMKPTY